jgi:hypothetical protein
MSIILVYLALIIIVAVMCTVAVLYEMVMIAKCLRTNSYWWANMADHLYLLVLFVSLDMMLAVVYCLVEKLI